LECDDIPVTVMSALGATSKNDRIYARIDIISPAMFTYENP